MNPFCTWRLRQDEAGRSELRPQNWTVTRVVRRDAIKEYAAGALWVLPTACAAIALVAGYALSHVDIGPSSSWDFLAFQGTADDARSLLVTIAGTVVTVIALVLGLTVVALQLSSTQFSPRLLRNFLRDRSTQLVLSVFLATFAYSAAGLYTVGVSSGNRVQTYPRLAVSGAMVLLFLSLAMVVFYANHLAHSIQIDSIAKTVEVTTLAVVSGLRRTSTSRQFSPLHRGRSRCARPGRATCRPITPTTCSPWQPATA